MLILAGMGVCLDAKSLEDSAVMFSFAAGSAMGSAQ